MKKTNHQKAFLHLYTNNGICLYVGCETKFETINLGAGARDCNLAHGIGALD